MGVPELSDSSNYDAGVNAVGTVVRADLDAIVQQMDKNLDEDNYALLSVDTASLAAGAVTAVKLGANAVLEANVFFGSSTGLLVPRCGPNYDGTGVPRIAIVSKEVEWDGTTEDTVVFTYADDCIHGDPGFTSVPYLLGAPAIVSVEAVGDHFTSYTVTVSTNLAITMEFDYAGASTATVQIEFGVYGGVS